MRLRASNVKNIMINEDAVFEKRRLSVQNKSVLRSLMLAKNSIVSFEQFNFINQKDI